MLEDKKLELEGMLMTVGDVPARNGASARLAKAPDKAAASSDAPQRRFEIFLGQAKIGARQLMARPQEKDRPGRPEAERAVGLAVGRPPGLEIDMGRRENAEAGARLFPVRD